MGDGNTADRVVAAPAAKATGYGVAAAQAVGRALGEAVGAVADDAQQLLAALDRAVEEWWVLDAREVWKDLAKADPTLSRVVIVDLGWWAQRVAKASRKPAIAGLPAMGYGAWTNSSSLILVTEDLFDEADPMPSILLSHEAEHVRQFRASGDRPPTTYWEMAKFEHEAYARTCASLDTLVNAGRTEFTETRDAMKELVRFFGAIASQPPGAQSEQDILRAFQTYKYKGKKDPLLPNGAGPTPDSLYVR